MRATHSHSHSHTAFLPHPIHAPATVPSAQRCRCRCRTAPTLRFGRIAGRIPPQVPPAPDPPPPPCPPKRNAALEAVCGALSAAYHRMKARLVGDTLMLVVVWPSLVWSFGSVNEAKAALLGSVAGFSYILFLSPNLRVRVHESSSSRQSAQPLRYLLLPLLVTHIARNYGLLNLLPALVGYFGYKVARFVPQLTGESFHND